MRNIFISYRRDDSIATAGRIRDRLVQEYGGPRVFVDMDDIPHGRDFVEVLEKKVSECGVLLALIGPGWLDARTSDGRRRLDEDGDFVAIEIASALKRKETIVIPVLIDGARLPSAAELPEGLKPLARRNAIELRNTQFGSDAARLVRSINEAAGGGASRFAMTGAWLAVAAVLAVGAWFAWPMLQQLTSGQRRDAVVSGSTAPSPVSATAQRPADLEGQIARLRDAMRSAEGRVQVGIRGGNRVRLDQQIVFEVSSEVPGRLVLADINAAGAVTQIFPNKFLTSEAMAIITAGASTTVPGPGYGFSGFRAVEPVGRGRLVAVVLPERASATVLAMVREQATKGFEPVAAPAAYLDQLSALVAETYRRPEEREGLALAISEYEIAR